MQSWCWEVERLGAGPDWLLLLQFAPDDAAALRGILEVAPPEGFEQFHEGGGERVTLIDTASARQYAANLAGSGAANIWIYNSVQLHRASIEIEAGYGGRGAPYPQLETDWLRQLLSHPQLTLASWHLLAGGAGYEHRAIAAGHSAYSLVVYLS